MDRQQQHETHLRELHQRRFRPLKETVEFGLALERKAEHEEMEGQKRSEQHPRDAAHHRLQPQPVAAITSRVRTRAHDATTAKTARNPSTRSTKPKTHMSRSSAGSRMPSHSRATP